MNWISIESDEKPEDDQTVLAYHKKYPKMMPEFVFWDDFEKEFMTVDHRCRLPVKVTHWMPIPSREFFKEK